MVTFAVPEYQSVAQFALGVLLDRARLDRVGCHGQHQLTISLTQEDVDLFREMSVIQGDCAYSETAASESVCEMEARREFERELATLQTKIEARLASFASSPAARG